MQQISTARVHIIQCRCLNPKLALTEKSVSSYKLLKPVFQSVFSKLFHKNKNTKVICYKIS